MKRTITSKIIGFTIMLLLLGSSILMVQQAGAHGAPETPGTRGYLCANEHPQAPLSWGCRLGLQMSGTFLYYNFYGINQLPDGDHKAFVPDGQLCSGGRDVFAGFDIATDQWPTTIIADGTNTMDFVFDASWAPHPTLYMNWYVTKDGFDPFEPLKWSDLEETPFCQITDVGASTTLTKECTLPDKSGRHIIYNVWQRSDSAEAFYGCSDVFFEDANNPAPVEVVPTEGQCDADPWLSEVTYFSGYLSVHNGKEWKANWWTNGDEPGATSAWTETADCGNVVLPTATPITPTSVPPTATPVTPTSVPPTATPVTPTATPVTPTPEPTASPTPTGTTSALLQLPDVTVRPSEMMTLTLNASDLAALSSATVYVYYDNTVVQGTGCVANPDNAFDLAICNVEDGIGRVSLSIVDAAGQSGDVAMMQLLFNAVGTNNEQAILTLSASPFADANGGSLAYQVDDGSVTILDVSGDVDCDNDSDSVDALFVLQYTVGSRAASNSCPPENGAMYLPACDVDGSNSCDVVDGLFILQCSVGINNALCPAPRSLAQRLSTASTYLSSNLRMDVQQTTDAVVASLSAEVPASNPLGAATFLFRYDADRVAVDACTLAPMVLGICNVDYAPGIVAISLISTDGLSGDVVLGDVAFSAESGGDANFNLAATSFQNVEGLALPIEEASTTEQISYAPSSVQLNRANTQTGSGFALIMTLLALIFVSFGVIMRRDIRNNANPRV